MRTRKDDEEGEACIERAKGASINCRKIVLRNIWMADLDNNYESIKILINGNNTKVIVPILDGDRVNSLFSQKFGTRNIRSAYINEYRQ